MIQTDFDKYYYIIFTTVKVDKKHTLIFPSQTLITRHMMAQYQLFSEEGDIIIIIIITTLISLNLRLRHKTAMKAALSDIVLSANFSLSTSN